VVNPSATNYNAVVIRPGKPAPTEYAPYYAKYIDLVAGDDPVDSLCEQVRESLALLRPLTPDVSLHRYAEGKWSLREVVGHLTDAERVFAYRALRFSRADQTALSTFDQDPYIAAAQFDRRPWPDLLTEFELVRRTTILLFRGLDEAAWHRRGVASDNEVSVRALAYIIAGHELHHMKLVRDRYLPASQPA